MNPLSPIIGFAKGFADVCVTTAELGSITYDSVKKCMGYKSNNCTKSGIYELVKRPGLFVIEKNPSSYVIGVGVGLSVLPAIISYAPYIFVISGLEIIADLASDVSVSENKVNRQQEYNQIYDEATETYRQEYEEQQSRTNERKKIIHLVRGKKETHQSALEEIIDKK